MARTTRISTTYRLLARHCWRKVHPDTKHPKSDPVIQEEFKKLPEIVETAWLKHQKKNARPFDVSGRSSFWAIERPSDLQGSRASQTNNQSGLDQEVQV